MHPERFAFVVLHDLLGEDALQISRRLSAEGIETSEGDILTIMTSPLYEQERKQAFDLFRRAAVRSAGDVLIISSGEAAEKLRMAMYDMLLKPSQRLRAAIEILDHVPETSKTLRQYVSISTQTPITDEVADRMASRIRTDPRAEKALEEFEQEKVVYRENLKALVDAK